MPAGPAAAAELDAAAGAALPVAPPSRPAAPRAHPTEGFSPTLLVDELGSNLDCLAWMPWRLLGTRGLLVNILIDITLFNSK